MFCPQCGQDYEQKVNFCCHCGAAMFTPPRAERKPLTLSKKDKKIAGVCGGFAEYLDTDPTLVRVLWVAATVFGGWGLIAYIIGWIIMPVAADAQEVASSVPSSAVQTAPNH